MIRLFIEHEVIKMSKYMIGKMVVTNPSDIRYAKMLKKNDVPDEVIRRHVKNRIIKRMR